jgi:hypothetical protein
MPDVTLKQVLANSPNLFPLNYDRSADAVQFIALSRDQYESASFLDARLLSPSVKTAWTPWGEVAAAAAELPRSCHFIFHISHVGSTLLSRLVGHHPALFSLREPSTLRTLVDGWTADDADWSRVHFDQRLSVILGLLSRTYEAGQIAVIKATSFVGEMAERLMQEVPDSRALLMYVPPESFLKGLLDGAMSDIAGRATSRQSRLKRRLGCDQLPVKPESPGESVAMSWLSEMLALDAAARNFPGRALWFDFERFLAEPETALSRALTHFGATPDAAAAILARPTMKQYAKATEHPFDARKRAMLLQQSEQRHAAEIRRGLAWLDRMSATVPQIHTFMTEPLRG